MTASNRKTSQGKTRGPDNGRPMMWLVAFELVWQVGLLVAVPIVISLFAGKWLDERLNGGGAILALCIVLGVLGGLVTAGRVLWKFTDTDKK